MTISSNTSAEPLASVILRNFCRKAIGCKLGRRLWIGSTITAAISSPLASIQSRLRGSPYGSTVMLAIASGGMPGAAGKARGVAPPPALTSTSSNWP